ncbi:MAG TPA: OmpH family outer membrane protein [Cytophagaceae bacterium]|jgi:outer membrane protein|nr:OmpH family outer membrane protein [Cytophagaceae bacterium]
MNNKIISIALIVLTVVVIGLSVLVLTKVEKIAYIDTGKLLEQSKEMQVLKKEVEKDQGIANANIDSLTTEFQESLKKYEKEQSKMTGKEKQLSQELLRGKQKQLIQYQQAVQQKTQSEEQKRTQEVLAAINAKIKEYGVKNGYKIIFATAAGNIAYADNTVDITEDIIKMINQ